MRNAETVLRVIRPRTADRTLDHWRAEYSETGTFGSEGGRQKRTRRYLAGGLPYAVAKLPGLTLPLQRAVA